MQMVTKFRGPTPLPPSMVRRMVDTARAKAENTMLATWAGRYRLEGKLTDRELATIEYIRRVYGRFSHWAEFPERSAKAPGYTQQVKSDPTDLKDDTPPIDYPKTEEESYHEAKSAWDELQGFLGEFHHRYRNLVEELCVNDRAVNAIALQDIRTVLDRVARELAKRRKYDKGAIAAHPSTQRTAPGILPVRRTLISARHSAGREAHGRPQLGRYVRKPEGGA